MESMETGGFRRNFIHNRMGMIGLIMIILVTAMAIFAPILAPYDPYEIVRVTIDDIYAPPSPEHPLGTDDAGKDVLSSFMYGARVSLIVGFFASMISVFIGGTIGITAGFYGGRAENIMMRFTDIMLVIPEFPLIIMLVALTEPSLLNIIFVIGLARLDGLGALDPLANAVSQGAQVCHARAGYRCRKQAHHRPAYLPHGPAFDCGQYRAGHLPGHPQRKRFGLSGPVRSDQDQLGADDEFRFYARGDERRGLVGLGDPRPGHRLARAGQHLAGPGHGAGV